MDPERLNGFLAGFVAGYRDALPDGTNVRDRAVSQAVTALERKQEGRCITCGRSGVVILDGYCCERCAPGIGEIACEWRSDDD